jgi:hypothetical protein
MNNNEPHNMKNRRYILYKHKLNKKFLSDFLWNWKGRDKEEDPGKDGEKK